MHHLVAGPYNVGFNVFRRDSDGLAALAWWRERCLEWCFLRFGDGRFGDQRYLEEFPTRFKAVHILEHPGGGLAPWNARGYDVRPSNGGISVDGHPLVFHHFSSLELSEGMPRLRRAVFRNRAYEFCRGPVPLLWRVINELPVSTSEIELLWHPYVNALSAELAVLRELAPGFKGGIRFMDQKAIVRELLAAVKERMPSPAHGV
jgi:hypothetical protein